MIVPILIFLTFCMFFVFGFACGKLYERYDESGSNCSKCKNLNMYDGSAWVCKITGRHLYEPKYCCEYRRKEVTPDEQMRT